MVGGGRDSVLVKEILLSSEANQDLATLAAALDAKNSTLDRNQCLEIIDRSTADVESTSDLIRAVANMDCWPGIRSASLRRSDPLYKRATVERALTVALSALTSLLPGFSPQQEAVVKAERQLKDFFVATCGLDATQQNEISPKYSVSECGMRALPNRSKFQTRSDSDCRVFDPRGGICENLQQRNAETLHVTV